jgi:uncharacterized protein (TIGR02145 family)
MKTTKKLWCQTLALIGATLILLNSCEKGQGDGNNGQLVVDADGNVYATVIIGNQEWIAENLRTTRYNDGSSIPTGHTNEQWASLSTGAYAIYPHSQIDGLNSDVEVLEAFGALYNWHAVTNSRELCPKGWRVPTNEEWSTLTNYAGGESFAGGKLKSTRTAPDAHPRWDIPNKGATNAYEFSAFPGGFRLANGGNFHRIGGWGYWWSSSEYGARKAWSKIMHFDFGDVTSHGFDKTFGFSVRCVRDN